MAANPEDIRKRNVRNNPKPVNKIYIAGIDPSLTGTGICVMNQDDVEDFKVTTISSEFKGIKRKDDIEEQILSFIKDTFTVCVEGYAYGARGKSILDLAGLGDIIRLGLFRGGFRYYEIPPKTLKKYVTSNGNAKKELMLEQCFRRFGKGSDILKDNNQVDAYCLARFYIDFYNWENEIKEEKEFKKYELDSFKKIGSPNFKLEAIG